MAEEKKLQNYDLSKFAGGQVQEAFNKAISEVFENLQDVNTPYKPARTITVKISFEQNEARDDINVDVAVDRKLASASKIKTKMAIAKDLRTGRIVAEEYGKQIKGQMSLQDYDKTEESEDSHEQSNVTQMRAVAGGK